VSDDAAVETQRVRLRGGCVATSHAWYSGGRGHVISDGPNWVLIYDGIVATKVNPSAMSVLKQLPNSPLELPDVPDRPGDRPSR
jgi:hypothetical protein